MCVETKMTEKVKLWLLSFTTKFQLFSDSNSMKFEVRTVGKRTSWKATVEEQFSLKR